MRRTSVSLPTKNVAHDPHEKPDRYYRNHREPSVFMKMQSAWVNQSQRARYIETGAIVFVVFCLFYLFSPSGVDIYNGGSGSGGNQGQAPADSSYGTDKC